MKIFDDIWASIKGNAKTRINEPIIGALVLSWCLCNWNKLAILFFSTATIEDKIKTISIEFDILSHPLLLFSNPRILLAPFIMTWVYLYLLPKFSHWVKGKLNPIEIKQHNQVVDLDISKAKKQLELNKIKLKANPDNDFLKDSVQIDINVEQEKLLHLKQKNILLSSHAEKAKSFADEHKLVTDKKRQEEEQSSWKFKQASAENRSTMASLRFPSSYLFLNLLSESLAQDGITLSLKGLSETCAAIFGYDDFNALLNDPHFTNSGLQGMAYVYYDDELLSKRLEDIVETENSENEDLSSDMLFDHISMTFDELPYDFINGDSLAEKVCELVSEDSYDLLNGDDLSGPIADSMTNYGNGDGVEDVSLSSYDFDTDFIIELSANASGSHHSEHDVPGRTLDINIKAQCSPVIGKFGLKEHEIINVNGSLEDYWDDEDHDSHQSTGDSASNLKGKTLAYDF
ncbi:hypothetical protein [Moritella viscosa]|uniref:Uncharacterized protein n=1 Tax=Moritella viscosa TaxID=80854 RepID=A0ABY1H8I7_9GAMM|nr:hypothetical protein [Moritella viscosa]SGY84927.1 Putative uncharacterized protein [Moritella viscosa]SGZ19055.1 Putative uncharacterized protein [Moritella viscosa]SHO28500.1 Putative uncharacterized protein [Moritella viscosa]